MGDLLKVDHLETSFLKDKMLTPFTKDVSFTVKEGETVGIVGESGSGKSITVLSIMGLLSKNGKVTEGSIFFEGKDLLTLSDKEMEKVRGNKISMIFQDTMSALNPVFTIGNQLMESIMTHQQIPKSSAKVKALELLNRVGLPRPEKIMKEYPFMLSGGMRQRAMIAMALSCNPKLLIADEPTTALDVTIQAQIIELLKDLKEEYNMSIILITHDMGVIAEMADRVLVMYAGEVVEVADVDSLYQDARHPYTKALLESIPKVSDDVDTRIEAIPGVVPEDYQTITGCRFYSRCKYRFSECVEHPDLFVMPSFSKRNDYAEASSVRSPQGEHLARCFFAKAEMEDGHE